MWHTQKVRHDAVNFYRSKCIFGSKTHHQGASHSCIIDKTINESSIQSLDTVAKFPSGEIGK